MRAQDVSLSVVEEGVLARLESADWQVRNGAEIALGDLRAKETERAIKDAAL